MSLAEQLLALCRETKTVALPEIGGSVTVTALTAGDFEFAMADADGGKTKRMHERVFVRAVMEGGKRVFSDEDVDKVAALPAGVVLRVSQASLAMSGIVGAEGN